MPNPNSDYIQVSLKCTAISPRQMRPSVCLFELLYSNQIDPSMQSTRTQRHNFTYVKQQPRVQDTAVIETQTLTAGLILGIVLQVSQLKESPEFGLPGCLK